MLHVLLTYTCILTCTYVEPYASQPEELAINKDKITETAIALYIMERA